MIVGSALRELADALVCKQKNKDTFEMIIPDWFENLNFAFSRKEDGQMSFKRDPVEEVVQNRDRFLERNNLNIKNIVAGELIHGNQIAHVDKSQAGRGAFKQDWMNGVDGFITDDPQILLFTTHADCAPVIVYDPASHSLGQVHAGWKGAAGGIIDSLVSGFNGLSQTDPNGLYAWIGPTIGVCCYEVKSDVLSRFPSRFVQAKHGAHFLDLPGFILDGLTKLGLKEQNIVNTQICTKCNPEFSSYRRDGAAFTAMACVAGLK